MGRIKTILGKKSNLHQNLVFVWPVSIKWEANNSMEGGGARNKFKI